MPTNILMPALSPTMEKGNLARWLKKEGDKIKSGDVIAEIETDKATMEYEAVDEGTLAKIVVPEGTQDVAVNSVIAVLAGEGEDVKAAASSAAKPAPPAKASDTLPSPSFDTRPAAAPQDEAKKVSAPAPKPIPRPAEAAKAPVSKDEGPHASGANRIFSSPLARRMAKDAGVDLNRVQGSGPHGRVIARDIEAAKSGKGLACTGRRTHRAAAAAIAPSMSDQQIRALYEEGTYELVPHDGMRRTIAQRLTASMQTVPHFYLTMDCNIGKLMAAREEINAAAPKDKRRQAGLQAFGQRLRHQGAGARAATHARCQCQLDRRRHAQAQAFRRRRGGGAARRADHADRAQCREQDAVGDFERNARSRRARAGAQAQAA